MSSGIRRQFTALITAFQFLTRIPLPGGMNRPDPDLTLLRSAVLYFPLVGAVIGAFTGIVISVALGWWSPLLAVTLGLIAEALLTGAFHEDAVADCCDAFGGGWTRDEVLRIMKDSRVGSFGALGLFLMVLLRGGSLLEIPADRLILTVSASGAAGRWAILLLMITVPPIPKREGLAKDVGEQIGVLEFLDGTLLTLALLGLGIALTSGTGVGLGTGLTIERVSISFAVMALITFLWGRYVIWRIGGITGDCLGCGCYLGQCVFLLGLCAGRGT